MQYRQNSSDMFSLVAGPSQTQNLMLFSIGAVILLASVAGFYYYFGRTNEESFNILVKLQTDSAKTLSEQSNKEFESLLLSMQKSQTMISQYLGTMDKNLVIIQNTLDRVNPISGGDLDIAQIGSDFNADEALRLFEDMSQIF